MHQIECCQINRWNDTDDIYTILEAMPGVAVHTFSCIGNCHQCRDKSHGIVNGKRLTCDSPDELLRELKREIK